MNVKKYLELEINIEERLTTYAGRRNVEFVNIEANYITRLNNLKRAFPQEAKHHYSKLMVKAYEGTIQFYERTLGGETK